MLRDQTLNLLQRHGVSADAALDEQQLIEPYVIDALIEASGLRATDTVLEIGPGAGNITSELMKRSSKVYAIEKNAKFTTLLNERFAGANVEFIHGDALKLYLPRFDVIVSNLPYSIVEATFQRLKRIPFRAASLLVPISFANILTAKPGGSQYSKLTLEASLFYNVKIIKVVKQYAYHPKPQTETAIITLMPRRVTNPQEAILWHFLQQGDKKVVNALREAFILVEGYSQTKRAAREAVDKLQLEECLLVKRVSTLKLADIELVNLQLGENSTQKLPC